MARTNGVVPRLPSYNSPSVIRRSEKHKKFLKFSGVQTEVELILARCGCFEKPSHFLEMTICPAHRARLGIGWRRPSGLCSVPKLFRVTARTGKYQHCKKG